jgi:glycosyltransferase involved in cell wall biosynthesis
VHNFYGSSAPSGENSAFLSEATLLRERGHDVFEFTRSSDEIRSQGFLGLLKGAFSTPWNFFASKAVGAAAERVKPDLIHVHNLFPLLSPSILWGLKKRNIPVVMTLHNYRLGCAAGTAVRNDQACTLCLERHSVLPSLRYGCYRKSRAATTPVAFMIALHRALKTWNHCVNAFIVLTEYQREMMQSLGLSEDRIFVKPHFAPPELTPVPWLQREEKAVYIGRLYEAKGIHILLKVWKRWGSAAPVLEVIGDGPLMESLKRAVREQSLSDKVILRGMLARPETLSLLSQAKLLIIPSLCPEGFPMVVTEGLALGVPIAASRVGSLQTLIDDGTTGMLFEPWNEDDMLLKISTAWARAAQWAPSARRVAEERYSAESSYQRLMSIYESARRMGGPLPS